MLFDRQAKILPEYGGNPKNYSDAQIRDARLTASQLRGLLAEYVQFGTAMDMFLKGEKNVGGTAGGPTIEEQQTSIYSAAQNEAKEMRAGGLVEKETASRSAFSNWLNNN